MRLDPNLLERVFRYVQEDEVCDLALRLAEIPSPTGQERALGEFMLEWLTENGFAAIRQVVDGDRINAVGIEHGAGGGRSLMFNGHLDVVLPISHEDLAGPGPKPLEAITPHMEQGWLFGTGMGNMKASIAAFLSAAKALKLSGIRLGGDLIVAGVAGEISHAPIDQYQGQHYRSKGVGTRYLLTHGVVSDYAIVADVSGFGVTWAECGVLFAKLTTRGQPGVYTPLSRRASDPRYSPNAVVRMARVIEELERWAARYERANVYRFAGGEIRPKVGIGAIAGGAPFKPGNAPPSCSIYVDVRIPPGRRVIDVKREMERALEAEGLECELELFLSQQGYEGRGVEPLVEAIRNAHETVIGSPPPSIDPPMTSMWSDTNIYNEIGIPAVKFGIGGGHPALREPIGHEHARVRNLPTFLNDPYPSTRIEHLVSATKIDAAIALMICGVQS